MAQPILLLEILLVALGIICLVLEFKAPGHFISGAIAVVCFAVFFWLHFQHGAPLLVLAVVLFVLGITLVGIEVLLIPGHGVSGVSGMLLVLAGLVVAGVDQLPTTLSDWADVTGLLLRHLVTMAAAGVVALQVSKHLPEIPFANRLVLVPPVDKEEADEPPSLPGADVALSLLGQVGLSTSMLRPAGIAQFGDRRVDVVTEWECVEPGSRVQVVEVEGTRIVVKKV